MKRISCTFVLFLTLIGLSSLALDAGVDFGSRDSAINVASGATFNVGSSNLAINEGTLKIETGASITGNSIAFNNGMLDSGGLEALMEGEYDPTGADYVRLNGNGRFRAEPGTLLQSLTVAGVGNRIEGQPLFADPITLNNSSTELIMDIQSQLNKNVVLNGGKVILDGDLLLGDNVVFSGNGQITFNGRQLRLGGHYSAPWANSLYLKHPNDMILNSNIDLSGTWTFGGISTLNGNGNVLNLSSGGQLILDPNSILYINDLFVTGLGDTAGKIIMGSGAQVRTANSTYKLNDNVTTNRGTFYVNGPTTFQLGAKNWTFNAAANLTVDGTTLWLDYLDSPDYMGQIYAPLPLYDGVSWNGPNLVFDLASGNLSLINRGTIKESVDASTTGFIPTPGDGGIIGNISGYHVLGQCVMVPPGKYIRVVGDATIDGRGAAIKFCGGFTPQLIIMPGVTLTLINVTLININHVTMDLRQQSSIFVDKLVFWELDEDITYSANATIQVLDSDQGYNVFTIRGETCRRMFNINPLENTLPGGQPRKTFVLGQNTVQFESAGISGFDYMTFASDIVAPAVALSGDSAADIDSQFYKGTNINFFVEGINNDLILRKDGMTLGGNISFGDYPDNDLHVRFNLAQALTSLTTGRSNVLDGFPFVILTGDPGIYVFSAEGLARLDFADFNAAVLNDNTNAFAVDDNSLLTFQRLQLIDNPVKQYSTLFRFEGLELLGERIDPSFIRMPRKSVDSHILITALHMQRQKVKMEFAEAQKLAKQNQSKPKPLNPLNKPKPKSNKKKHRTGEILKEIDLVEEEVFDTVSTRNLNLPVSFDQPTYVTTVYEPSTPITGNLQFDRAVIRNFRVLPDWVFNIVIRNTTSDLQGTVVELGEDTVLTSNHKINVRGTGNIIRMTHDLTIGPDNLYLEEGADITFLFPDDAVPSTLFITANTQLNIQRGALIRFSGPGSVIFGANTSINFEGVKTVNSITKAETVSARSYLEISNDVKVSVAANAELRMTGIGEVDILNRGKLVMNQSESAMIFGSDESTVNGLPAENVNDFIFDVRDGGEVNVADATVAFHYVTSRIRFNNGGSLFVDDYGVFQINSFGDVSLQSMLKELDFGIGVFTLREHGVFAIGPNKTNSKTGGEHTFLYNAIQAMISGEQHPGMVHYLGSGAFGGRLNVNPEALERYPNQTALNVVRNLVNRNSTLLVSTYYQDLAGKYYVRTINGVIVQLGTYDVITYDTTDGYIHGDNTATGKDFTIAPNGTRTNA